MNKKCIIFFLMLFAMLACGGDDPVVEPAPVPVRRTIIVYVTADNNISSQLQNDITEMIEGSKSLPDDCRLILFSDYNIGSTGLPYIAEIKNGVKTELREYANDFYATSADNMTDVLQWIVEQSPADEYALIMTGHGSGSIITEDTIATTKYTKLYAYGYDNDGGQMSTAGNKWMNISSIATALSNLKDTDGNRLHFEYIFFDCCCMQTVEVAYELRNYTDYIIAPVSETPANGAPYTSVVPILGTNKDYIGAEIIKQYIENTSWGRTGGIAISAIKTSELQKLLELTRNALHDIHEEGVKLQMNTSHCIYYFRCDESDDCPVLYDMKNLMLLNLEHSAYETWLNQFNKTVVAKHTPIASTPWQTNINIDFYAFTVTDDNYGGLSMFIPREIYDTVERRFPAGKSLNKTMLTLEWTNAIGWHDLGW